MTTDAAQVVAARLLNPRWPAPAHVGAAFSLREGGLSQPPYDQLNLGDHVGDDPACVAENRRRWAAQLPGAARVAYLEQVHGTHVVALDAASADGQRADAAWTQAPGLACTVLVADCLPVLLCGRGGRPFVAAAHAGWRGLAAGVLESTLTAVGEGMGPDAGNVMAWLGPCIGPQAFEVGDEVRAAFLAAAAGASRHRIEGHFRPGRQAGKWWCDLAGIARDRLRAAGVDAIYGNDGSASWCTWTQSATFFSHRRDAARLGASGRMAASIWIRA